MGALAWSVALLGLSACTTSIAGAASFAGPRQTTAEGSIGESTDETPEETTDDESVVDPDELLACLGVELSYTVANENFVAWATASNSATPTALTAESVASDFDAAISSVQVLLDPLPSGAVRDAVQAAQTAAGGLRDGLRAGAAVDNSALIAALDALDTACAF